MIENINEHLAVAVLLMDLVLIIQFGSFLDPLRTRNRLMHDGLSFTKQEAIDRHRGQADAVRQRFNALTAAQRAQLMKFLESL